MFGKGAKPIGGGHSPQAPMVATALPLLDNKLF